MSSNPSLVPDPADPAPGDCAGQLEQRFPALFGGGFKPLKLRIQDDIQQRAPGVFARQALSAFLRRHTGSTGYLVAMTKAPHRLDLDGQPSGEVSPEHRQAAMTELARRRALHQARIEQAQEGRRMRAALLHDFKHTTLTPANFCALKGIAPQLLDALLATARQEAREQALPIARRADGKPRDPPPDRDRDDDKEPAPT